MGINVNIEKGSGTVEKSALKLRNFGQDAPLPVASADTLGGVKVGEGLSITDAGVLSASGGGGDELFIITLSTSDNDTQVDKTFDEIYQALENNPLNVCLRYDPSGTGAAEYIIRPVIYGIGNMDLINFTVVYYVSGNILNVCTVNIRRQSCTLINGTIAFTIVS